MLADNTLDCSHAESRILSALSAAPRRVPFLVGPCGSGRTSVLMSLVHHLGRHKCQYIDAERTTSTPELFLSTILDASPYSSTAGSPTVRLDRNTPRDTFEILLDFFAKTKSSERIPATFVIDEILELRTFENFPGLRDGFRRFLDSVLFSANHFVFSSRYVNRVHHLLREFPDKFELINLSGMSPSDVIEELKGEGAKSESSDLREIGQILHSLTDGRPSYLSPLLQQIDSTRSPAEWKPLDLLSYQLTPGATIYSSCRFSYELRLHRSRGHGSLKAILSILAEEEPLTLTEVALRIGRTPGSTRDYLLWLEDVDLISVHQKQYFFTDPMMRLWVRLHCRPVPPSEADLKQEILSYAVSRVQHFPQHLLNDENDIRVIEPTKRPPTKKSWDLVEID